MQDSSFLASIVFSVVGETGLEARAGSLERRTRDQGILGLLPAGWWLELSAGPLVDRATCRGDCGAGGLKAACLLMGVAVSPPRWFLGLSHPTLALSAVGEGEQVLVQVQELKGEFHDDACQHLCPRGRWSSLNGFCQCLCPQGEL